ncbi:MAG: hypothetical protein VST67_10745 [Nitrospirota bacterium]|nr:hypothetical protein [Nitrospirota bacterium]
MPKLLTDIGKRHTRTEHDTGEGMSKVINPPRQKIGSAQNASKRRHRLFVIIPRRMSASDIPENTILVTSGM